MSEKVFTREEVEKALDIVLPLGFGEMDPEDVQKKLEGMSEELKIMIAAKLTIGLFKLIKRRAASANRPENPLEALMRDFKEKECSCRKECTCDSEEVTNVHILKNGKPATKEEKTELLNFLKEMFDKD